MVRDGYAILPARSMPVGLAEAAQAHHSTALLVQVAPPAWAAIEQLPEIHRTVPSKAHGKHGLKPTVQLPCSPVICALRKTLLLLPMLLLLPRSSLSAPKRYIVRPKRGIGESKTWLKNAHVQLPPQPQRRQRWKRRTHHALSAWKQSVRTSSLHAVTSASARCARRW